MPAPTCNFLNLEESEINRKIHRFMSIDRLLGLFVTQQNVLVRPKLWDDPMENFLFKARGRNCQGVIGSFEFRHDFYGQCWTKGEETDAMWRIYSPDKNGVRITTTIRKLLDSLYDMTAEAASVSCFLGAVEYRTKEEIYQLLKDSRFVNACVADTTGREKCRTLLIKRREFTHEDEIRLIYKAPTTDPAAQDIYRHPFCPRNMISHILFDPRMDWNVYKAFKQHIYRAGDSYNYRITQSGIYRVPPLYASMS